MSSILEALKKLEEEKSARRSGTGNLVGKIAKTGRRPRQTPAWVVPGGMLAVAVVSILITYVALNGFSSHRGETAPVNKSGDGSKIPETLLQPAGAPVADAPESRRQIQPLRKKTAGPLPVSSGRDASSSHQESSGKPEPPASPVQTKTAPESTVTSHPTLNISGIAWQPHSAYRLAVINGIPVREGGVVEGTTVKEIFPDRVRFSANGKEFELSLDK
jgi:general secretion pathway protein B